MSLIPSRKRAQRRARKALMKRRARRLYPHDHDGRLADHLAACSCAACGNPRRHHGERTIQERRAEEAARHDDGPQPD